MNATRCKMRLRAISGGWNEHDGSRTVEFVPVGSGSDENKRFYAATPSGKLEFTISGAAAKDLGLDQGKIGSEFYVDITPASASAG